MTRIAVIGSTGMLGHDLMKILAQPGLRGFSRAELDITNTQAVIDALPGFHTVINSAAYTQVDAAEKHETEAFAINSEGARNVARACAMHGQRLIHVSTDYVFDGLANTPYPEDHPRNPVSVYGKSKAAGEEAVLQENPENSIIIRTAWLYGAFGPNFVTTMLRLASERETVSVVNDQVGQPTWSIDLARMVKSLVDSGVRRGIFHGTNSGQASWFDFARTIYQTAGLDTNRILSIASSSLDRAATRPAWSVFDHKNWKNHKLPEPRAWQEGFSEAWESLFSTRFAEDSL